MMYGRGHLKDRPDARDYPLERLVGSYTPATTSDLTSHIDRIRSQGNTNMCTGFALTRALHVRWGVLGIRREHPSPAATYAIGRYITDANRLVDEGAYPRDVCKGLVDWGSPAESDWPFDMAKVNLIPDWDALRNGDANRVTADGYYRIVTTGQQRIADIERALSMGYPIAFAMSVTRSFEDLRRGQVFGMPKDPPVGGHYMTLVGHQPGRKRLVNSWGESWADGGLAWVDDAVIASELCDDFIAIEATT